MMLTFGLEASSCSLWQCACKDSSRACVKLDLGATWQAGDLSCAARLTQRTAHVWQLSQLVLATHDMTLLGCGLLHAGSGTCPP